MSQSTIKRLIAPRTKDLGGFSVKRILPIAQQKMIGPWIFFDHMGPADFAPGEGIDVRPHPHINLATVTYLFSGEILHRDSLGSCAKIVPGDINLMVAGSGIVHSERETEAVRNSTHHLDGLQLWLALPAADEEIDPAFYHHESAEIPIAQVNGVAVRVLMGQAYQLRSPVKTFANTIYIEATLQAGQSLTLPMAEERGLYVANGKVQIDNQTIERHHMAVLENIETTITASDQPCRIAMIGGESLGHRFIEWNFVSSRQQRIEQAKNDWQQQNFPQVPGDENEYIPLP